MSTSRPAARHLAERHLAVALPRRWAHVQGVADRAETVAGELGVDPAVLVTAAWLHDIGYSPDLVDTGFHPIDGARYLRRLGYDEQVVRLVAHHTAAHVEAEQRGLGDILALEFPLGGQSVAADALWYCDLTVGPDGTDVSPVDRLSEICTRYGPGHVVARFARLARGELLAAVDRVEHQLAAGPVGRDRLAQVGL